MSYVILAPAPLFCRPKKHENDFTGKWGESFDFFCSDGGNSAGISSFWRIWHNWTQCCPTLFTTDYGKECNQPWSDPPLVCTDYEGQVAGGYNDENPVANLAGRTDVEGCCWWGRGGKIFPWTSRASCFERTLLRSPSPSSHSCIYPYLTCACILWLRFSHTDNWTLVSIFQ